jgi:hypothetical protein
MVSLAEKRRGAEHLEREHGASERRACQVIEIARSSKRRPSGCIEEAKLIRRMHVRSSAATSFNAQRILQLRSRNKNKIGRLTHLGDVLASTIRIG